MIKVSHSSGNIDQLLRIYKRKIDDIGLVKKVKSSTRFIKDSTLKRKRKNKAICTLRYKVLNDLV